MEQLINNDQEQMNEQEYIQGFNHAALIADYEPNFLTNVTLIDDVSSSYFEGFFDFKEHLRQETFINKQMDELGALRQSDKEKEDNLERE